MKLFCLLFLFLLSSVSYAQNKIFDDSATTATEISTNSIRSDFGPFAIHDTLYFTSFNEKNGKIGKKEFYDLFISAIDKKGDGKSRRQALNEFFTRYNDGPISWCEKTGELFVTQNYIDNSVKKKPYAEEIVRLKIIIAKKENGKWWKTGEFPYHDLSYSVGHPAISETGDTLIFASDMPGGFGKTDLYYSVRKEGKWETPVNLGPKINTSEKEEFAFITDKNFHGRFLIFSSTRNNGIGGLDLYYTKFPDFKEIGHFNSPINTVYDDFALTIPPNAEFGYLTSNRPGTGDDDIYKFTFKRIKDDMVPEFRRFYVFDIKSKKPIPGVTITLGDKSLQADAEGKISVAADNKDCDMLIKAEGYKVLSRLASDKKDTIWMDVLKKTELKLSNIYYDLDKWDILSESAKQLDRLVDILKENPDYKVKLTSYTDDRGSIEYNLGLSWQRTKSAMDYIILKGIDRARITGENYGESQLINKCSEGCTSEQYRENRRTEICIPGVLISEPVEQIKGDFSSGINVPKKKNTANGFLLVLNSFKNHLKASKYFNKMERQLFKVIITKESDNIRVGIPFESYNKAKEAMESYKEKFKDIWILPVK